jgi:hypothetical protein
MKKAIAVIVILSCLFTRCKKDDSAPESIGVITGMDGRKCACCWGWLVEIDNQTYKFDKIPATASLDLNTITYPTTVKIKWRDAQDDCKGKLIEVLHISRQ